MRSGAIPVRDETGDLDLAARHGVVFVLVPAGADGFASVEPFFLAKHELSRGQWSRLAGGREGLRLYDAGLLDLRNLTEVGKPANGVPWTQSYELLRVVGLRMPSQLEWCRAASGEGEFGDDLDWEYGANLLDESHARFQPVAPLVRFDDGYPGLAPITSMEPDSSGFHHLLGNVSEWCSDASPGSEGSADDRRQDPGSNRAAGGRHACRARELMARSGRAVPRATTRTNVAALGGAGRRGARGEELATMTTPGTADSRVTRLLTEWHSGRAEALAELLAVTLPRIRQIARARLGAGLRRRVESSEIVQDTLIAFRRGAPKFVVETEAQLVALLAKIVERNIHVQHRFHHQQQREVARDIGQPSRSTIVFGADPAAGPGTQSDRDVEIAHTRLALELLDSTDHRIVTRRVYDGVTFEAIAEECGMSADAVRKRFDRSMPKLRRKLMALRAGSMRDFLAD